MFLLFHLNYLWLEVSTRAQPWAGHWRHLIMTSLLLFGFRRNVPRHIACRIWILERSCCPFTPGTDTSSPLFSLIFFDLAIGNVSMNFRCLGVSMNLWFVAPTPRPADQQGCRCLYELMVCSSDTSELLPLPASLNVTQSKIRLK